MFKLDNNFLIELGLGALPAEEKNKMLAHIYETLEMRVGMKLAEQMTDAQLDEFEGFINRQDEAGALNWLESNFPNYKQVVADELEKLKGEIKQVAPQIVAESMNAANNISAGTTAPQYPPAGVAPASAPAPQPYQPAPDMAQAAPQPYQPTPAPYADPAAPAPAAAPQPFQQPVQPPLQPYQPPAPAPQPPVQPYQPPAEPPAGPQQAA
jgi:hypothetical protein